MSFGKRLFEARKKKGFSQKKVAEVLNTKGPAIGRYERDEMRPSIDVAAKLADLLDASLDYLMGRTEVEIDTVMLDRIVGLQQLPADVQDKLFFFIDMTIRDFKARQAYGQ